MNLEILTPEKKIFDNKVDLVQVPGTKGPFAILRNHAPIISTLKKGKIRIVTKDNKTSFIDVFGGIIEVKKNNIIILADVHK